MKLTIVAAAICSFVTVGVDASAQTASESAPVPEKEALKTFLRGYLHVSKADESPRYSAAYVNLDGQRGKEIIVYVTGKQWCGTGGCGVLVLSRGVNSYRVITKIPVAWPPIRVLDKRSHGWRSLGVWVQGGGVQPGYEAELDFNGRKYPFNPSVAPARKLRAPFAGKVVISREDQGEVLN